MARPYVRLRGERHCSLPRNTTTTPPENSGPMTASTQLAGLPKLGPREAADIPFCRSNLSLTYHLPTISQHESHATRPPLSHVRHGLDSSSATKSAFLLYNRIQSLQISPETFLDKAENSRRCSRCCALIVARRFTASCWWTADLSVTLGRLPQRDRGHDVELDQEVLACLIL